VVAGAFLTFGFLAAASVGLFVLPFGVAALALAVRRRRGWPAAGIGAGTVFLAVAWINRGSNGLDARPWFAGGAAAAVAGIAGVAASRRR
jgi:hypothetical protein